MTRRSAWVPIRRNFDASDKHTRNWKYIEDYLEGANVGAGQLESDAVTEDALADGAVTDAAVSDVSMSKVTQGTMHPEVILAGSLSPATTGQRPIFDANGIRLVDSAGSTLVNFPTSGGDAFVKAFLEALGLNVTGKMILGDDGTTDGHSLAAGATLTVAGSQTGSAVSDPSTAPTISQTWETLTLGTEVNRVGLTYDSANTSFWTTKGTYIYEHDSTTGTLERSDNIGGAVELHGVVRVGTRVYVLLTDSNGSDLVIKVYAQSDLHFLGQINVESRAGASVYGKPGLGSDGTNLIVVGLHAYTNGQVRFHKFTFADSPVFVSTTTTSGAGNPTFATAATAVLYGFAAAESSWWVATSGGWVYKWTTAGVAAASNTAQFPGNGGTTPRGVAHDGTRFWTMMSDSRICKHTNWDWTTESAKYWVAHTWVDDNGASSTGARPLAAGDYETKKSPSASVTLHRRGQLFVTVPTFPTSITHAGIYVDRGAAEPSLDYVIDTSDTTETFTSFTAGGTTPPASNTFPSGGGGTGEVKSAVTGFQMLGDGTGEWRYLQPPGAIVAYAGTTAPNAGWLLCNGAAVSRTTYATLFAVIGTAYNIGGEAGTDFRLPDLRGRFPIGLAPSGTGSTLGGSGGSIDHLHGGGSHSHSGTSHSHGLSGATSSDGGHAHDSHNQASNTQTGGTADRLTGPIFHNNPGDHSHSLTLGAANTGGTGSTGSASTNAADNPPFQAVNFLIKC